MIGLIILNFKTYSDTCDLINSLMKIDKTKNIKVYIVDNNSDSLELEHLKGSLLKFDLTITYLPLTKNIGFAKGMNEGINAARRDNCEYIICSNNDILFDESFSFSSMIEEYITDKSVAIIGPRIINLDKEEQNPLYLNDPFSNPLKLKFIKFIALLPFFGKLLFIIRGLYNEYIKVQFTKKIAKKKFKHSPYCLHGSFFLLTPAYFLYYDELDSNTFLYYEELILAKRTELSGLKSVFHNKVSVIHKEDSATNSLFNGSSFRKNIFVLKENYRSLKYYLKNYS